MYEAPEAVAVIGDRLMTDVLFANKNNMLSIWTRKIVTEEGDNTSAKYIRKFEYWLYNRWLK